MVEIFREVKRVLRDDGVFWLNYGDCYDAGTSAERKTSTASVGAWQTPTAVRGHQRVKGGTTAGNLMLMPHRVALALQADGWIVRQDLVWYKRNPMPEPLNGWRFQQGHCDCVKGKLNNAKFGEREVVNEGGLARAPSAGQSAFDIHRDPDCPKCGGTGKTGDPELKRGSWRHTRAHEYVFMLTKKMQYWSNQEAVREGFQTDPTGPQQDSSGGYPPSGSGRNPRSVLDVPTAPYKGAHYATFPPNLIAPLIRATCPRRCCPVCGQGWAVVVEQSPYEQRGNHNQYAAESGHNNPSGQTPGSNTRGMPDRGASVLGYRPTCEHPHTQEEAVPGIVFDPFVGSGTTVKVAQDLLRKGIGIDISMEYLDLQAKVRIGQGSPSNQLDDLPLFQ